MLAPDRGCVMADTPQDAAQVEELVVEATKKPETSLLSKAGKIAGAALDPGAAVREWTSDKVLERMGGGDLSKYSYQLIEAENRREAAIINPRGQSKLSTTFQGSAALFEVLPVMDKAGNAVGALGRVSEASANGGVSALGAAAKEGMYYGSKAGGPLGGIGGGIAAGAVDALTDLPKLKRGIEEFSSRGVPGFAVEETQIDGQTVKVYVDASETLAHPNAKPWSVADGENGLPKEDVKKFKDAVKGKAIASVEEFRMGVIDENFNNEELRNTRDQRIADLNQALDDGHDAQSGPGDVPGAAAADPRSDQIAELESLKIPGKKDVESEYADKVTNAAKDMMPNKAPSGREFAVSTPELSAGI